MQSFVLALGFLIILEIEKTVKLGTLRMVAQPEISNDIYSRIVINFFGFPV